VAQTGEPNYLVAKVPVPSTLNISTWRKLLQDYEDSVVCDFLEFGQLVLYPLHCLFLTFGLIVVHLYFRTKLPPIEKRKFLSAGLPVLLTPCHPPMALWFAS